MHFASKYMFTGVVWFYQSTYLSPCVPSFLLFFFLFTSFQGSIYLEKSVFKVIISGFVFSFFKDEIQTMGYI